jgi:hypothetical protein
MVAAMKSARFEGQHRQHDGSGGRTRSERSRRWPPEIAHSRPLVVSDVIRRPGQSLGRGLGWLLANPLPNPFRVVAHERLQPRSPKGLAEERSALIKGGCPALPTQRTPMTDSSTCSSLSPPSRNDSSLHDLKVVKSTRCTMRENLVISTRLQGQRKEGFRVRGATRRPPVVVTGALRVGGADAVDGDTDR